MPGVSQRFDPETVEWRRVADPDCKELNIDFEYSLLGYDIANGRLDMLLRYGRRGYCRRHRHVAATATLVLDGEQHLTEIAPDGSTKTVVRRKGDYALAPSDAHPHLERGGDEGGTVLLSMSAPDGLLFEYFDENMENGWTLSIAQYVEAWNSGAIHGAARPAEAARAAAE